MSKTIDDARRLIESRLADLADEARQLERALSHLRPDRGRRPRSGGKAGVGATPPSSDRHRGASRRKAAGRAPRGRRREELLAAIEASPGARPSELAKTIGIRPTQVSVLIAKARAEKLIVRSGEGYALKK